ncbi:MAG: hypothetical protein A2Y77_01755 [Planctomycetes bacterium RBG_13_62_9]|nr:MAG: hypothetical protein A2Y77_01755 [Planctomycetes bacterium RBG_13_62_9]
MADMIKRSIWIAGLIAAIALAGCVERRLTIHTEPPGATVVLNDQQIGEAPVTVPFNWYGDHWVRISMEGYETLDTHRELKAPLHDYFPFDFFAQILYPGRIVDSYEWTFELSPKVYPTREHLLKKAATLKGQIESTPP